MTAAARCTTRISASRRWISGLRPAAGTSTELRLRSVHGVRPGARMSLTDQVMRRAQGKRNTMRAYKRLMLVPALMGSLCCAQDGQAQKPACNAENHGMLWPEHISGHDQVPVEMCSVHLWKYKWRPLTVDVSDLVKGARSRASKGTLAAAARPASTPPPSAESAPAAEPSPR